MLLLLPFTFLLFPSDRLLAKKKSLDVDREKTMTVFEQVIGLTRQLSSLEKLRLIENLTRDVEVSLQTQTTQIQTTQKRRSLRGLLKGCSISAEEIEGFSRRAC